MGFDLWLFWAGVPLVWLARQVTPPPPRGPAGNLVGVFVVIPSEGGRFLERGAAKKRQNAYDE